MVHKGSNMQDWVGRRGRRGCFTPRRGGGWTDLLRGHVDGAVVALPAGGRWSIWRCTRVTGFLQKVAGESQVCMRLQHYQPRLCKDPRMGVGSDHCGEGEGNVRVGQELHLGSELNRQRNLSNT